MTWTTRYSFTLSGPVPGKARPRVSKRGTYMPKPYEAWRKRASAELEQQSAEAANAGQPWPIRLDERVRLLVSVTMKAPRNRPAKTAPERRRLWCPAHGVEAVERFPWLGMPDADNVLGSIMDLGNRCGLWLDDRFVGEVHASLYASHRADLVGAVVQVQTVHGGVPSQREEVESLLLDAGVDLAAVRRVDAVLAQWERERIEARNRRAKLIQ